MICRICGSDNTRIVGELKPYLDYSCIIRDCGDCGCRFAPHDGSIYDKLHSLEDSPYLLHEDRARIVGRSFLKNDLKSIKKFLYRHRKNRFVIDTIEKQSGIKKVMEMGCSKGYLTAYFISRGFNAYGTDVSGAAIREANKRFGGFFYIHGDPAIDHNAPYDAIYHVGTIGCVDSPVDVTEHLLHLLKPGGILIFNAPNVRACLERDSIWVRGAHPPDLTTLFKSDFWTKQFKDLADVSVCEEYDEPLDNLLTHLRKCFGFKDIPACQKKLFQSRSGQGEDVWLRLRNKIKDCVKAAVKSVFKIIAEMTYLLKIIPRYKSEFGIYIIMRRSL